MMGRLHRIFLTDWKADTENAATYSSLSMLPLGCFAACITTAAKHISVSPTCLQLFLASGTQLMPLTLQYMPSWYDTNGIVQRGIVQGKNHLT